MDATIISIGSELMTGQTVDTNAAWLSARITRHGVRVRAHVAVGDDVAAIKEAIGDALATSTLVLLTGGLGPTVDDLTREALAAAIGEPLELDERSLEQIKEMFVRLGRPFHQSNARQAMIPRGAEAIPNLHGTAPGIHFSKDQLHLFAFPGVPSEMKAMFDEAAEPIVTRSAGGRACHTACLQCFGISEAKIGERIEDLMRRGRNPAVGTAASAGVISIRVVAMGHSPVEAATLLGKDVAEIRDRFGESVFGEGEQTLQEVVGDLLREMGKTVATAESCTGGLLAKRLTDIPGSSAYFHRGYVAYADTAKISLLGVPAGVLEAEGAVSEAVAESMAQGCREAADADYGLSITGIAGPGGGQPPNKPVGLVFIGLAEASGVAVRRITFGQHLSRDDIRDRSCKTALFLLRRRLLDAKA